MEIDVVEYGRESYVMSRLLDHPATMPVSQWWTLHGRLRSFQWRGTRKIVKVRDGFVHHLEEGPLLELLRESESYGAPRPGSYAGMWWSAKDRPHLPRPRNFRRRWGLTHIRGAWQEAMITGPLHGEWVHYDIRSAYLWALSLGLPDPNTLRWIHPDHHLDTRDAVYLCGFRANPGAPFPYNRGGDLLATMDEMDAYDLEPVEYYGGFRWDGGQYAYDTTPICDSILRYAAWKAIARSWWGYLCSSTGAVVHTSAGSRELPPYANLPVWAHLIVGRVRARLWEIAQRAGPGNIARVYVDSVIVRPHVSVPVGELVGDWREETRWTGGEIRSAVHVHHHN